MAPIRRYLRITKYSVLECRIYLENPALAHSWLLHPRDPVLPRVIESVRPLVLPKLREEQERERNRKKNSKKRSIKDVVTEDDFEVSIFLTETPTRHSLLHKRKHFRNKTQTKLTSNSSKLTGASHDAPIDVDDINNDNNEPGSGEPLVSGGEGGEDQHEQPLPPGLRREDSDEPVFLADIPAATHETSAATAPTNRQSKRRRSLRQPVQRSSDEAGGESGLDDEHEEHDGGINADSEDELFVGDSDEGETGIEPPSSKRRRDKDPGLALDGDDSLGVTATDDKKKMMMDISYEGFAIYGRVLCLVVRRRDGVSGGRVISSGSGPSAAGSGGKKPGGQASMENWITSTQLLPAAADDLLDAT